MLCKDNVVNLDYKSKKNNAKHIFPSFSFLFFFFILKKITKATYHEMHKCYAMQILKKIKKQKTKNKTKQKQQRKMVIKSREMKHKDHVRKSQLN